MKPSGWTCTTLQSVTSPRGVKAKPASMLGAPFVGLEHIEAHSTKMLGMGHTSDVKSAGSYFAHGDVLYGRLRPYLNKVYMAGFEGLASGEFIVFQEHPHLDNAYLKYFLNQAEFVHYATRLNTGDRPRVDFGQLADYPFPLAPLPEQHRIVAEIEKQFTRLDASIAALKRAEANLKRYRASVLKAACEGRLVPTEAELARAEGRDYEPADRLLERILSERRARWESQEKRGRKYKEPVAPNTSNLPKLPEGWVWAAVGQASEVQGGIQKQPKRAPAANMFPFLRVANVSRGVLDLDEVHQIEVFPGELDKLKLVSGDLLIVEGNGSPSQIGRMAIWKGEIENCVHQNHIIRARLADRIVPQYVETYWNSPVGSSRVLGVASSTSGLYTLSVSKVSALPIPLPPLAEQHRIVTDVERRLSVIQQTEAAIQANLTRAGRLRQSILKQAFSGRLVPQDPSDEPASVLLERIRAEREAAQAAAKSKGRAKHRRAGSKPKKQPAMQEELS